MVSILSISSVCFPLLIIPSLDRCCQMQYRTRNLIDFRYASTYWQSRDGNNPHYANQMYSWNCFDVKAVSLGKYVCYVHKTSTIMFIIPPTATRDKPHFSRICNNRVSLFIHVIFQLTNTGGSVGQSGNDYHSQIRWVP